MWWRCANVALQRQGTGGCIITREQGSQPCWQLQQGCTLSTRDSARLHPSNHVGKRCQCRHGRHGSNVTDSRCKGRYRIFYNGSAGQDESRGRSGQSACGVCASVYQCASLPVREFATLDMFLGKHTCKYMLTWLYTPPLPPSLGALSVD